MSTAKGNFFVQSTDATGQYKTAEFLCDNVEQAMASVGADNVFILCMDGACKRTLTLFEERNRKKFGQRCSTHGCSLLVANVAKSFTEELKLVARLLQHVCNHDGIYDILFKMEGCNQLLGVIDSRLESLY